MLKPISINKITIIDTYIFIISYFRGLRHSSQALFKAPMTPCTGLLFSDAEDYVV